MSNDEACTDYSDVLRNFEVSSDWLRDEFGFTPTIGWQLDPFGHSVGNAHLYAEMGLEAIFMARINEDDKSVRRAEKNLEFIWAPFLTDPAQELLEDEHASG